jgi:hypothetical protein
MSKGKTARSKPVTAFIRYFLRLQGIMVSKYFAGFNPAVETRASRRYRFLVQLDRCDTDRL